MNSVTNNPAPPRLLTSRRKGESVTPAIGDSTSGGEIRRPAI
jgi:hypothetical protein